MTTDDELESAAKYADAGTVIVTYAEKAAIAQRFPDKEEAEAELRRLLASKGVPMCGKLWPAYHPDFQIQRLGDPTNERMLYRWRRRALSPEAAAALEAAPESFLGARRKALVDLGEDPETHPAYKSEGT